MFEVSQSEFMVRLVVAALCGLLVGIDREIRQKPLGARTYVLVTAASSAWVMVTINFSIDAAEAFPDLNSDPTRVIQGLIGAIGFLGAGAIITQNNSGRLRGVASWAAIWGTGVIGIACGLGYFAQAFAVSFLFFAVLNIYDAVERVSDKTAQGSERNR
ncbi:MgtC/SapB family protein [Roseobacter denitrificans]|uniref:Protein MgtC n=1 Tax=Roseobacter denitrificans (strain ATCC 33942 / OCh 114) TaxID=375451 RepID=Q166S5_ROSDO|nr:MgtC/SapB family protein [Roseobacter denitrificans]ABG32018.1 MgtC family protein [Roseobacter denitrificans OCh 114]AVL51549.1 MgtC/SapB family protein [Roseobacter denitrificans]SFG36398.1 putative Mg2+ transporter-C (MgtC) family protein [Roseobacter denitrificans OCh 114]